MSGRSFTGWMVVEAWKDERRERKGGKERYTGRVDVKRSII